MVRKGYQHLDFYLPQYNVAIECQGEQHFRASPHSFFYERDERKNKLCLEHNIPILYLSLGKYDSNYELIN